MLIVYFSPAASLNYVNLFMMIKSNNNSHQKPQFSDQSWSQVPVILLPETAVHFSSPAIYNRSPHSPHLLFTDSCTQERASKFIAGKQNVWQSPKSESFNNPMPAGVRNCTNWCSFPLSCRYTRTYVKHTNKEKQDWGREDEVERKAETGRSASRGWGIMTCL